MSPRALGLLGAVSALAALIASRPAARAEGASLRDALRRAGVHALERPAPADRKLVALGRALFQDPILSGDRSVSCATCHDSKHGTTDGRALERALALGGPDKPGPRNVPGLWNAGLQDVATLFWDARVGRDAKGALFTPSRSMPESVARVVDSPLAAQALSPVLSFVEMRGRPGQNEIASAPDDAAAWAALTARLRANATYRSLLREAYPDTRLVDLNFGHAARAIAAFEREEFTALDSPFDRYLRGDEGALDARSKRGAALFFGAARCAECHKGPLLSDFASHALAVPQVGPGARQGEDRGAGAVTTKVEDDYRFRTPPLRNVALTAPYMHDGCFATLESCVRHHLDVARSLRGYDGSELPVELRGQVDRDPARNARRLAALDPILEQPIRLSDREVSEVVSFLNSLTSR